MQVYINSYSTLFNKKSIQIDFDFQSKYNPCISLSWDFEKSAMYASGARFDWTSREIRKNPHYRRFTGKPKHPNMGSLDIYLFPPQYVESHSKDRLLMCKNENISLSAFYRHEAEVIFFSYIPKAYHYARHIITLPSFNQTWNRESKKYFAQYGITHQKYQKCSKMIFSGVRNKKQSSSEYIDALKVLTEASSSNQASIIEGHMRENLTFSETAIVYPHGNNTWSEKRLSL
jgi:hypothetical protein